MGVSDGDGFEVYARRVETWLLGSRRQLAVFDVLSLHVDRLRWQSQRSQDEWSGCFYAAYLHAGLAVENAIRAWQVACDPSIVRGHGLDRNKLGGKNTHSIAERTQEVLGELSETERRVLVKLEEHLIWSGKYTVPLTAAVLHDERKMEAVRSAPMNEGELIHSIVRRLQERACAVAVTTSASG